MNVREYIASGILENYVLGLTGESESREIEALARQYPEIQLEIDAIEKAMNEYALKHAINPPAALKEKVLDAVKRSGKKKEAKVIPFPAEKKINYWKWTAAAAIFLLCVSGGLLLMQETNFETLNDNYQTASDALKSANEELARAKKDLAILKNPMNKTVELKGMDKTPGAKAMVYYDLEKKTVFLELTSLPMPPDSMQYQLWAIKGEQKMDLGLIDLQGDTTGIHPMKNAPQAEAFAITLEKKGGSESPKGDMIVMGKI
jgi:anti-sigma-K factor RskA